MSFRLVHWTKTSLEDRSRYFGLTSNYVNINSQTAARGEIFSSLCVSTDGLLALSGLVASIFVELARFASAPPMLNRCPFLPGVWQSQALPRWRQPIPLDVTVGTVHYFVHSMVGTHWLPIDQARVRQKFRNDVQVEFTSEVAAWI